VVVTKSKTGPIEAHYKILLGFIILSNWEQMFCISNLDLRVLKVA